MVFWVVVQIKTCVWEKFLPDLAWCCCLEQRKFVIYHLCRMKFKPSLTQGLNREEGGNPKEEEESLGHHHRCCSVNLDLKWGE